MAHDVQIGPVVASPEHAVVVGLDRTFDELGGREGDTLVGMVGPEVPELAGAHIRAYRSGAAAVRWAVNVTSPDLNVTYGYTGSTAHELIEEALPPDSVALPTQASINMAYVLLNTDWGVHRPSIPGQRAGY
jgi:hypothetical protein